MNFLQPYTIKEVIFKAALKDTAADVPINGKTFMISNGSTHPAYILPKVGSTVVTATTGMVIPANSIFPTILTCPGDLSVISDSTGTDLSIMILDIY